MVKKRRIKLLLFLAFSLLALTACSSQRPSQEEAAYALRTDTILGLTLNLPEKELDDWTVLYGPFDQSIDHGDYAPIDGSYLSFMPMESSVILFSIQYYDESKWDGWMQAGCSADEITGASNSEEIGRKDGMVYVYTRPEPDEAGMDSDTKKEYQRILSMLPAIRESISLTTRGAANTGSFPNFSTTDLTGNVVDNTAFADYQITMLNIWGTFCGPCIEEMPDLDVMSKNMPEGTRLIGLISDALDDESKSLSQKIILETGVTYPNWIPDAALSEYVDSHVIGVPTTLFIDTNGQIIGDALIGKQNTEDYMSALTLRLNGTGIGPSSVDNEPPFQEQKNEEAKTNSPQQSNTFVKETKEPSQSQVAGPAPAE